MIMSVLIEFGDKNTLQRLAYSHSTYLSHSLCAVQPFIATIFFKFFSDSSKLSHNSPVVSAAKKNLKTVQMSQK